MAEELIIAQGGKTEKYEVLYRQIAALVEGEVMILLVWQIWWQ